MFWTNGVEAGVVSTFGTPELVGAITNAGAIAFMGYGGGQHTKGTMLECAIFDVRLSAQEIASLANAPLSLQPHLAGVLGSRLRGYWTLNEVPAWQAVTGQAWNDYSGWNCHLTATNSPQSRPGLIMIP